MILPSERSPDRIPCGCTVFGASALICLFAVALVEQVDCQLNYTNLNQFGNRWSLYSACLFTISCCVPRELAGLILCDFSIPLTSMVLQCRRAVA